jgi:carbohydrate-selective porin OprB
VSSRQYVIICSVWCLAALWPGRALARPGRGVTQDPTTSSVTERSGDETTTEVGHDDPAAPPDARTWLQQHGIVLGSMYVAESFGWLAPSGPARTGGYLGSYVPFAEADLAAMGAWRGRVFASAQLLRRRAPAVTVAQPVSNLDADPFGKLAELWYGDSYWHERLRVKVGLQYADTEFGAVDVAAPYLNGSYGGIPTTPMPAYPDAAPGVAVWLTPQRSVSVGAGVFRGAATPTSSGQAETRTKPFAILEARIEPCSACRPGPAAIRVGVWRQAPASADHASTAELGVYAAAERRFGRSSPRDDLPRDWGVFLQWGRAVSNRQTVTGYLGGGLVRNGPVAGRPGDVAGIGVTRADLNSGTRETAIEVFYRWRATSGLTVQPDVQWFTRPAGEGRAAVAIGIRVGLEL